ncbi:unnamed protein product [Somion occarium]|uniref:Cytochrome b-c1 complex subunit 10 n=1 Tax=Somion occarium TaxID=3059160 RepID=A0ABP1D918_9APHY
MSARVHYQPVPPTKSFVNVARTWAPSAIFWGAAAGIYGLYFLSVTPLVKREFLVKVPVIGSYYEDKTPASDKPF